MTRRELFENLFRPPEGMTFRIWGGEAAIVCPFKESCIVCPYYNHKLENHGCDIPWWNEEVDKSHSSYLTYLRDIAAGEDPVIEAIKENNSHFDERPNIDFTGVKYDLGGDI